MEPTQSPPAPQMRTVPKREPRLVALNFRVPFEFRQRVKLAAATRELTMTQLVMAALESYLLER